MKIKLLFIASLLLVASNCFSQTDTLDVFRTPSKSSSNSNLRSGSAGNNAISMSIGHLGRGGTMLTYERFINNSSFAVFAGYGITKVDFIGQFSYEDEGFNFEDSYSTRTNAELGSMIDLGFKYLLDRELGGNYFGFTFSSYHTNITRTISSNYVIQNSGPKNYQLDYFSREVKFVYGSVNDVGSRFYSDFNIGTGFRFIDYQNLDINEVPVYINNSYNYYNTELDIRKKSNNDIKLWLFIAWKIGVRF
jgi:hypothetical protein